MRTETHQLALDGGKLSAVEATALEQELAEDPSRPELRTKLLGYYFLRARSESGAQDSRRRHVIWLIENMPESEVLGTPFSQLDNVLEPDGYENAKTAWQRAIEKSPDNLVLLKSASQFFLLHDRKISEELMLKGMELAPENPEWPKSLGRLFSLGLMSHPSGEARKEIAGKAFDLLETAYKLSCQQGRESLLADLAKTGFEAGRLERAKQYAETMLANETDGWNQGNQTHHGNLVLGRIALLSEDVEQAKSHLLLAGKTCGSPQLNSFGPNMLLAKELLERGEKEVVLAYFELCKEFWSSPRRDLEQWIDDVQADRSPQFGANLAY